MEPIRIVLECAQGGFEMVLQSVDTIEHAVMEKFFPQFIPDVFDGVQLGCVGRQAHQPHVSGNPQCTAGMPASTIHDHDNALLRMSLCHLIEKQLHARRVDLRQNQRIHLSRRDIDGSIGIGIFMGEHGLAEGAHGFGCPATTNIVDPPKACLVLEQNYDWVFSGEGCLRFLEDFREFFFQSSCACGSLCG